MAGRVRIQHQPAYILRRVAYTETSWILDVFTRDYGRQSLIAKGARKLKSQYRAYCMPFQPVQIGWSGRTEMGTVTGLEANGQAFELTGHAMVCAYYVNELVLRLLQRGDPYPEVFADYATTLTRLGSTRDSEAISNTLRQFEINLLRAMGYAPTFSFDNQGQPIDPDVRYGILNDYAVVRLENQDPTSSLGYFGRSLLALHEGDFDGLPSAEVRRLLRTLISLPLGRPLASREVMRQMVESRGN